MRIFKVGSVSDTNAIYPRDIYSTYYMFLAMTMQPALMEDTYLKSVFDDYTTKIREKYLKCFTAVIYDQLLKYVSRKRVTPDFGKLGRIDQYSLAQMYELMKKTFRSDMQRQNTQWNMLCDFMVKLEAAHDTLSVLKLIDRINNTVHNTQESMVTKLPNGREMLSAFDAAHNAKNFNSLGPMVYGELKPSSF